MKIMTTQTLRLKEQSRIWFYREVYKILLGESAMRKLPIGIQDFEKLRIEGFVYIDKTDYIHQLVQMGTPVFLSRPRRFGKSLFLSTLRAYWEGKKELFEGLKIAELEKDDPHAFEPYPVFYFDFNRTNFGREMALEEVLSDYLWEWEEIYGDEKREASLESRFQHLLVAAKEQTAKRCVVLVDEYDKPLLETDYLDDLREHNRAVFKGFFSTLKSYDKYLEFVFLTGVTKFSKVSIFSDLNQLEDISLDDQYAFLCGITAMEMRDNFMPEIIQMARDNNCETDECLDRLRQMYDGYHFSKKKEGVYNPFSLLNALKKGEFSDYWFETGTPTFLVRRLKKIGFDPRTITDRDIYMQEADLMDYRIDNPNPVPLLYQSGYLTITGVDKYGEYQLDYPNEEVKYGFVRSLAPFYLQKESEQRPLEIGSFLRDMDRGDTDSLKNRFVALYAGLPYATPKGDYERETLLERDFQIVIYLVFTLMGQHVYVEPHSAKGRADMIVEMDDYVYIFEFKRDKSAREALLQIEKKAYAASYAADKRTILKIGANFDSKEHMLTEWEVRKEN